MCKGTFLDIDTLEEVDIKGTIYFEFITTREISDCLMCLGVTVVRTRLEDES